MGRSILRTSALLGLGLGALSACASGEPTADGSPSPAAGPLAVLEPNPVLGDEFVAAQPMDGLVRVTERCVFFGSASGDDVLLIFEEAEAEWDPERQAILTTDDGGGWIGILDGDSMTLTGHLRAIDSDADWSGWVSATSWTNEPDSQCQAASVLFVKPPVKVCCDEAG